MSKLPLNQRRTAKRVLTPLPDIRPDVNARTGLARQGKERQDHALPTQRLKSNQVGEVTTPATRGRAEGTDSHVLVGCNGRVRFTHEWTNGVVWRDPFERAHESWYKCPNSISKSSTEMSMSPGITITGVSASSMVLDNARAAGSLTSSSHSVNLEECRSRIDLWTLYTNGAKLTRTEPS